MPHFTTFDGLNLHYDDQGDGLAVLCLAGLTRNGRDFDHVAPHLDGVRLIRMDYRGRGQSDYGDWRSYTIENEARDAIKLLDHLGLADAAILGTSRGGLIAMLLGLTDGDRVRGVALNDIGPELDTSGLDRIAGYLGKPPPWTTLADAAAAMPAANPGFTDVPPARWRAQVENNYVQGDHGLQLRYDPKLRDAVLEAPTGDAPDLWPLFDALAGKPVALIRGANSDLLGADTAQKMQDRHPGLIYREVPGRAHVPFLDEAPALEALRTWIQQCR
ncbi:alpha/beta fold hydrolase [Aliiroseovarius sp. PTFE2010]|uniref:alpha/beta fold hydrolase n=1 Tax=Aliiroseovarius sp. PTFE2010 TaxID=3417190 RepID=UPI003CF8544F